MPQAKKREAKKIVNEISEPAKGTRHVKHFICLHNTVVNDCIPAPALSLCDDTKNLCRKWWVCPFLLHGCGTKKNAPIACIWTHSFSMHLQHVPRNVPRCT